MIDLTTIPLEDLQAEVDRRLAIQKAERKKNRAERVCCNNCANKILGRTNYGSLQNNESWVCSKRPKTFAQRLNNVPHYLKAYYACNRSITECSLFVNKNSPEGLNRLRELVKMADRIS